MRDLNGLFAFVRGEWFKLDLNLREEAGRARLLDAFSGHTGRTPDGFAVTYARFADANFQSEIALQPVLFDFQVQYAHAGHEGLAGLHINAPIERWVLAFEKRERIGQLLLVGRCFRLDRPADDGLSEMNGFEQN